MKDGLSALWYIVTAPFPAFLIALFIVAVTFTAYTERKRP